MQPIPITTMYDNHYDCLIKGYENSLEKIKEIGKDDINNLKNFNPNQIQTNREKYVVVNELNIFESIYMKI